MRICVYGLWHLGCVTAACLAEHFPTVGLDPDPNTVADLQAGEPPIFEPGLSDLIRAGLSRGTLTFTNDVPEALSACEIVWVAFDTPVDDEDRADAAYVEARVASLFPHLCEGSIVLISSQIPVGTTRRIEDAYRHAYPARDVRFAYSPENLRLGKALEVFRKPGRIVIGTRTAQDCGLLRSLLATFSDNLIWMSVESAEMTKHALNAFLANSIAFINEVAGICEEAGADAKQVEIGLKSDERIGPRAYLSAGAPFAGGTLARDVAFLTAMSSAVGRRAPLLESIKESNNLQKDWPRHKLQSVLGNLAGRTVAVLGLTYKPGTNTLRRSAAIELCRWLRGCQTNVIAYDPAVQQLPDDLSCIVTLAPSALTALEGSDAVVIATEWPQFRELKGHDLIRTMRTPIVLDANRFLEKSLQPTPSSLVYFAVGTPKGLV
jgi:UDPglucose 6-dehydrogenase